MVMTVKFSTVSAHSIHYVGENRKHTSANCGLYGFGHRSRQFMKLMTGLNDRVVADACVAAGVDNGNNSMQFSLVLFI
jgi:hypothetical protein